MMYGDFINLFECKLMDCLNCFGYDIEIKVWLVVELVGYLMFVIV